MNEWVSESLWVNKDDQWYTSPNSIPPYRNILIFGNYL